MHYAKPWGFVFPLLRRLSLRVIFKPIMHPQLLNRLESILTIAKAHYEAGGKMTAPTIGAEREIFVRELLEKIFPNTYRFSYGDIIDLNGNSAGQIDVAMEFPYEPTFPSPVGDQRLILAESVICSIEVKSTYPQQWDQLIDKVTAIKALTRSIEWQMTQGDGASQKFLTEHLDLEHKVPVIGVFYVGPINIDTLVERLSELPEESRPTAIFTLDKGHFIYGSHKLSGAEGVLGMISLISHLSTQFASARSSVEKYI